MADANKLVEREAKRVLALLQEGDREYVEAWLVNERKSDYQNGYDSAVRQGKLTNFFSGFLTLGAAIVAIVVAGSGIYGIAVSQAAESRDECRLDLEKIKTRCIEQVVCDCAAER